MANFRKGSMSKQTVIQFLQIKEDSKEAASAYLCGLHTRAVEIVAG